MYIQLYISMPLHQSGLHLVLAARMRTLLRGSSLADQTLWLSRDGAGREIAAPSLAKGSVAAAPIDWVEGNDLPPADRAGEVEREGRGAAAVRRIGLWFAARPEGVGRVY
jgi:hypothetical protein